METQWISWVASAVFVTACCCGMATQAAPSERAAATGKRVLFIGNSYTSQIKGALLHMLARSSHKDATFEFITRGGVSLRWHLNNKNTLERIKTGNWDAVVLQDQSQTPALPGRREESFQDAVDAFTETIRDAGAEPVLYMTWGRRDGDERNPELFPDYETMQQKLTTAYRRAAARQDLLVAPVGEAWRMVRSRHEALGRGLYKGDGSHPSAKGAFLASCVFFRTLFNDSLESVTPQAPISGEEAAALKTAAMSFAGARTGPKTGRE